MRMALDHQNAYARDLLKRLRDRIGSDLADALVSTDQSSDEGINKERELVTELKTKLAGCNEVEARDLLSVADALVKKNVWIVGGDGW